MESIFPISTEFVLWRYYLFSCIIYQAASARGGYAGVDVFFVISGYLIIGGIVRDLSSGSFSFASFYYRRAKRIIPAYFIMISATLLVGVLWYSDRPFYDLGSAVLRSFFFAANHYFYKFTSGYFAQSGESHPLLNIWSLSVEEQFYIIIPLMIWTVWKLEKKDGLYGACMHGGNGRMLFSRARQARECYIILPCAWMMKCP